MTFRKMAFCLACLIVFTIGAMQPADAQERPPNVFSGGRVPINQQKDAPAQEPAQPDRPEPPQRATSAAPAEWRGIHHTGPLTGADVQRYAALGCNFLLVESPDFYNLDAASGEAWADAFGAARKAGLEPVPVLNLLSGAQAFLAIHPELAEGRLALDRVNFAQSNANYLSRRNIINTASSPIIVRRGETALTANVDYTITPGVLNAPYSGENAPWIIRRTTTGALRPDAQVEVYYTYVPPDTGAVCMAAPEAEPVLRAMVARIAEVLAPKWMHIDHGQIERIGTDIRSRSKRAANHELFIESVRVMTGLIADVSPGTGVIIWADAVNPLQDAEDHGFTGVAANLPEDVALMLRFSDPTARLVDESVQWIRGTGHAWFGWVPGSAPESYNLVDHIQAAPDALGIVIEPATGGEDHAQTLLAKARGANVPSLIWPQGLNRYFNARLWQPGYEEVRAALVEYMNQRTVDGVSPEAERQRFAAWLKDFQRQAGSRDPGLILTEQLYFNLLEWVRLESEYVVKPDAGVLTKLSKLVEAQADLDPAFESDREAYMLAVIREKALFAPASILFKSFLLPYRPLNLAPGQGAFEIAVTPEFHDIEHEAQAIYDFLDAPGPVFRIDFDSADAAEVIVETSTDGENYTEAKRVEAHLPGGVRGPIMLSRPVLSRFLRVRVVSPSEQAVLRTPRVFALKEPAAAISNPSATPATLDAMFHETAYPREPQIYGFVDLSTHRFAEGQTTVRVFHTADTLYLAAYVRENRMDTRLMTATERDDPLWQEESLELRFRTPRGDTFRFVVSPLAMRYDSRNGDPAWNGAWEVTAKDFSTGWAAEIAIPFKTFNANPGPGETWKFDVVRHRVNVKQEKGVWAFDGDAPANGQAYGLLNLR